MLLKQHFWFGVKNGGALYIVITAIALFFGLFSSTSFFLGILAIVGGAVAVVLGSVLPDMDAPRSPIHDGMLVFFSTIFTALAVFLGISIHPIFFILLVAGPAFIVYADRKWMPKHRGIIHTSEAGLVEGGFLAICLIIITGSPTLGVWMGFWLAIGHSLHLVADRLITIPEKMIIF